MADDLSSILKHEELIWFQRSRAKWLTDAIVIRDITVLRQSLVEERIRF